jgi:hypothetical protein
VTKAAVRTRTGVATRISGWVRRCQHQLYARIHAAADDRARRYGWTVTETTGRLGFAARSYRDPRFGDRHRQPSLGAGLPRIQSEPAPTRRAGE